MEGVGGLCREHCSPDPTKEKQRTSLVSFNRVEAESAGIVGGMGRCEFCCKRASDKNTKSPGSISRLSNTFFCPWFQGEFSPPRTQPLPLRGSRKRRAFGPESEQSSECPHHKKRWYTQKMSDLLPKNSPLCLQPNYRTTMPWRRALTGTSSSSPLEQAESESDEDPQREPPQSILTRSPLRVMP